MDSHCEWATVEGTAYDQYIDYFKKHAAIPASLPFDDDLELFGGEDDETDIEDLNDDYNYKGTPRRLEKRFALESEVDFVLDQPPIVRRLESSPDGASVGRQSTPTSHHRRRATRAEVMTPQSAASVASSLSISTMDGAMLADGDGSLGPSPYTTPSKSTCSSRRGGDSMSPSPKYNQKLWTPEVRFMAVFKRRLGTYLTRISFVFQEDQVLLRAIHSHEQATLKWSVVAKAVPGRSGKQCRERYLNHLTPNIKLKDWSPVEDAAIFRLYQTVGTKWSMMSKIIRGRTDNGIKNRYHHLKRRLDRQMQATLTSSELGGIVQRLEANPLLENCDPWVLKYVAIQSLLPVKQLEKSDAAGYLRLGNNELCARCALFVPSLQTGRLVCKTTGWCEVCIRISPCLSGDMLRILGDMRKDLKSE